MLSQVRRQFIQRSTAPTRRFLTKSCTAEITTNFMRRSLVFPAQRHLRNMSTPAPQISLASTLSEDKYHNLADATMEYVWEALEGLLDDICEPSYEVDYHSGVLTLKLGDKGTYVINKQPPNKQIWLSSPFSGPKRFDFSDELDEWQYSRDGCTLGTLLETELSEALGQPIDLRLPDMLKNMI